jgi:hypothetical protein
LAAVAAVTFLMVPEAGAIVWDDFQSYTNFQRLASGFPPQTDSNSGWGRFGAATADNPLARVSFGPNGATVGDYPLVWSLGNNGNLVYHFVTPTNLTATPGFSLQLMVTYLPESTTSVLAVFEDRNGNIWQTTPAYAQPLTPDFVWQTFRFVFSPEFMGRQGGSTPFELTAVTNLRIRFQNAAGDTAAQHIYFFDLQSLPPQPVLGRLTFGAGDSVSLPFTSSDAALADVFVLETSSTLEPSALWLKDVAATLQSLGSGAYTADTIRSGNTTQFYRLRR